MSHVNNFLCGLPQSLLLLLQTEIAWFLAEVLFGNFTLVKIFLKLDITG